MLRIASAANLPHPGCRLYQTPGCPAVWRASHRPGCLPALLTRVNAPQDVQERAAQAESCGFAESKECTSCGEVLPAQYVLFHRCNHLACSPVSGQSLQACTSTVVDHLPPQVKEADEFHRDKGHADGRWNECKQCRQSKRASQQKVTTVTVARRLCGTCRMVRAADCFYRSTRNSSGLDTVCIRCKQATKEKVTHARLPVCTTLVMSQRTPPPLCLATEVCDVVIAAANTPLELEGSMPLLFHRRRSRRSRRSSTRRRAALSRCCVDVAKCSGRRTIKCEPRSAVVADEYLCRVRLSVNMCCRSSDASSARVSSGPCLRQCCRVHRRPSAVRLRCLSQPRVHRVCCLRCIGTACSPLLSADDCVAADTTAAQYQQPQQGQRHILLL
jgi:hypothetical protein